VLRAHGWIKRNSKPGTVSKQRLQFLQGAGQEAEGGAEHGDRLAGLENPGQGVGLGQILEVADVQLLVEVGREAFQDHRLGRRGLQGRQHVVGRREVVVVVDALGA